MLKGLRSTSASDRTETVVALLFYGSLLWNFARGFLASPNAADGIFVLDQTMILLFILTRRPARDMTDRPLEHLGALAGTMLPMLAVAHSPHPILPPLFCGGLMLGGILIQLGAKLTLRRSFGLVAADRGIKSGGMYRLVRHPMYLGYMIVQAGLLFAGPLLWNALVFAAAWMLFLYRIEAEERLLGQNAGYRAFCSETRYRLIPGVY